MTITFYSLQGLGNSIINFPVLNQLRRHHEVQTIAFRNGSSAFFRAFHPNVVEVKTNVELFKAARKAKTDASFSCYPTWRREFWSAFFSRSKNKYLLRPPETNWHNGLLKYTGRPNADVHHIENNFALLRGVPGFEHLDPEATFDLRVAFKLTATEKSRVLGIHPTASSIVKYYSFDFWTELLISIGEDFEQIWIFCGGSPTETSYCEKLLAGLPQDLRAKAVLHQNRPFGELVNLLNSTTYFIGTDSALMHLAAFLDKPLLGLWSFANYRVIYPYGRGASLYVPKETLTSHNFEYSKEPQPYLRRASARTVSRIYRGEQAADFTIPTLWKGNVKAYVY